MSVCRCATSASTYARTPRSAPRLSTRSLTCSRPARNPPVTDRSTWSAAHGRSFTPWTSRKYDGPRASSATDNLPSTGKFDRFRVVLRYIQLCHACFTASYSFYVTIFAPSKGKIGRFRIIKKLDRFRRKCLVYRTTDPKLCTIYKLYNCNSYAFPRYHSTLVLVSNIQTLHYYRL